jgi:hypothetical protein
MAVLEVGVERMVRVLMDKSDSSLRCPLTATFKLNPPVIVVVSLAFRAKAGNLLLTSDRGRVSRVAVQVTFCEHVLESDHIAMLDYFIDPVVCIRTIWPLDSPKVIVIGPSEAGHLLLT